MRSVEFPRPAGTPLSVDVTSAGGRRPVVLLCGVPRELAARLARAGFAAVSVDCRTPADVGTVLDALKSGALRVEAGERVAVVVTDEAHGQAAAERGAPWCVAPAPVPGAADERSVETIVQWLARHLV